MGERWSRRVPRAMVAVGIAAVLGLTACSTGDDSAGASGATSTSSETPEQQAAPKPPAKVALTPASGATDVSPVAPVKVTVADGTIEALTLTNPTGKKVIGQLSADKTSWTVGEPLGYGKTYTWAGTATGTDGETAPISGSFTTVTPAGTIDASLNVGDGRTYGVAMPIVVRFDSPVTDKAAVQKAMTVTTSVPTEGAWAWLDDRSAHWRPKTYWAPGTQVNLDAKLYGLAFGDGVYGAEDRTAHFTIGRSQIVKANTQTHRLVVIRDGKQVADFPASYGLESDPGRVTNSGTHVVMSKHETYAMTNPKYDYENVVVPWAVRISNNGEFIHGYAPSIWAQGKENVSHGCANLAPANAKIYFDSVMTGDPVEIVGSTEQLGPEDGDYYDWALTWDQWLAKSAV
ncbi:Ig-like domain-containing protein [Actinophytocola sp. NPDC049390]|uniref:L,D-transpeptidase n=1 Tax=Actinophytocola sp. NPDC049390 TaxID=3363894 RepID=UPI0037B66410